MVNEYVQGNILCKRGNKYDHKLVTVMNMFTKLRWQYVLTARYTPFIKIWIHYLINNTKGACKCGNKQSLKFMHLRKTKAGGGWVKKASANSSSSNSNKQTLVYRLSDRVKAFNRLLDQHLEM